jgi:hypothetical protein
MYVDVSGHVETGKISSDSDKPDLLGDTLARRLKEKADSK